MKERRGLFEAIFGKKPQKTDGYTEYKLLNSYQSNFVPFSGNAWEVNMVRAAVHSFARRAATVQPRHIRRGDGKVLDVESSTYNNILQFKPNPTTTAYKFYYRLAAQYKLYNNAFAYPVWNEATGRLEAIYNINAQEITLLDHEGELFCKFRFNNGKSYIFPYADLVHIGSMFADNDVFGSDNGALMPVLKTANTFNQSMSNVQLAQALTNCIFSKKERGYGNEITVEGNKLQFARTSDKLAVVKYLSDIGGLMLDQALTTLGYPPIGGEEGKRRVQTLNVVNANKADEYQLGTDTKKEEPPEDGNDNGEGTAPTAAPDDKKDEEET